MLKNQSSLVVASLCLFMGLVGCAENSNTNTYLLPVLGPNGDTRLEEVTLETLTSKDEVSGEAAVVYYNPELTFGGVNGKAARTRLTRSGNVYVPMDVPTSSSLSVYHSFEKIMNFERRVLPESTMSWPRTVGLDIRFADALIYNNAFYSGLWDFVGVLPYDLGALPLSFNSGVVAHEHFHAHFFRLIASEVDSPTWRVAADPHSHANSAAACGLEFNRYTNKTSPEFQKAVNGFVVRGWNEGLADLYAALVTGNTNIMDPSINQLKARSLEEQPTAVSTRVELESALELDLWDITGECNSMRKAYETGTQIARTLYRRAINGDFEGFEKGKSWTREERALRFVFHQLRAMSMEITTAVKGGTKLEPSLILEKIKMPDAPPVP